MPTDPSVPSPEQREWVYSVFIVCLLGSTFGGLVMLGIGIGYLIWGQI